MSKQVQQFITRMNQEIKNKGLVQLSGTVFGLNHSPMDALRAKAFGAGFMGKPCTVAQAAADMNAMMDIMDALDGKPIFRKRLSSGLAPRNVKVTEMSTQPYVDGTEDTYLLDGAIEKFEKLEVDGLTKPYSDY